MPQDLVICPKCGERFELEAERGLVVTCPGCAAVFNAAAFVSPLTWERIQRGPGDAPEPRPEPAAGETALAEAETFSHYELISEIGRNDLAVVYRAREVDSNQIVALKVLLADSEAVAKAIPAILERVRAAASLQHENIAQIYEVGEHEGTPFVASEFVEGRPLDKFLAEQRLSVSEVVCLAATAARALAYAHSEGHIHGNMSPENIIIDSFGNPRLTDFGMARSILYARDLGVSDLVSAESRGYRLPVYIPPEQANGVVATTQSDVYSLGAVLYEMLAGRPPVQADHLLRLLIRINRDTPRPARMLNPRVPTPIDQIVGKCLAKEPEDRYVDGRELSRDLEAFMSGRPVSARMPGTGSRAGRWLRRRKGALAGLVVAAALAGWAGHLVAGSVSEAIARRRQASLSAAKKRFAEGIAAFDKKTYAKAAEDLAAALAGGISGKDRMMASYRLARSYRELGRAEKAEKAFTDFVNRYPEHPEGWHFRGLVRYSLKRYDASVRDFEKAVELEPENGNLRYCLGMSYWRIKNYPRAEIELARAVAMARDKPEWGHHSEAWGKHLESVRSIIRSAGG